jgi:hypothetical protein
MGDKISRRSFLKGTGKTILTAGALSSGIGISTSTTPVKTVIPKATALNVLSPKAKAYRSYLKGLKKWSWFAGQLKGVKYEKQGLASKIRMKRILTKQKIGTGKTQAIAGQSPARQAFESATKKAKRPGVWPTRQERIHSLEAKNVARQIIVDPELKKHPSQRNRAIQGDLKTAQDSMIKNTGKVAREELARELREQRRLNKKMKTKSKGARVGGGGKMALPGLESAKNPTGMSLVTQRYTL